ncbi:hypothetical protein J6590_078876 [Homalodisca vitripennis]|nr:hypothetical protein J6590_078876 [Homalodisca vitripennis]
MAYKKIRKKQCLADPDLEQMTINQPMGAGGPTKKHLKNIFCVPQGPTVKSRHKNRIQPVWPWSKTTDQQTKSGGDCQTPTQKNTSCVTDYKPLDPPVQDGNRIIVEHTSASPG